MATKSERFAARAARTAKPPLPKQPSEESPITVDTSLPDTSADDSRKGATSTVHRNEITKGAVRGGAVLEDSATGKPSRKSTRKSQDHTKANSNLTRRQQRRVASPEARARRASVSKTAKGASTNASR